MKKGSSVQNVCFGPQNGQIKKKKCSLRALPILENPILMSKKYLDKPLPFFLPRLGYKNITRKHENRAQVCKKCVLALKMIKI